MCGPMKNKYGMVMIVPLDKSVQSMYEWGGVCNVLFLSFSFQTIQLFNEYGVDIFNHYKGSDKKTSSEYTTTK